MKQKKGTSLIELLVVMVILAIMMSAFTQIYVNGMKTYREQLAQTRIASDVQTIVDKVTSDIKISKAVEPTYDIYTTSNETLILLAPATDSSQNFIYSGATLICDRIIYYRSGSELHKVIFANTASSRYSQNGQNTTLTSDVSSLTFSYQPDISVPGIVGINLGLSKSAGKSVRNAELFGKAKLRNNL